MKNIYTVRLINVEGCIFDNGIFTSLKKARSWASGRGQSYYTVEISKNIFEGYSQGMLQYRTK